MRVCCVTGATGFVGAHVARLAAERGDRTRVTFRDEGRLGRLATLDVEPVRADVLDRAALRRAVRGCELVFHTAGYVGSRPVERVWEMNALAPRLVVEAAAAEGVRRVVHTSSVAAVGRAPQGKPCDEATVYRSGEFGLAYGDAKHEGEAEALAAGARLGVEVVVVNPAYVLGVPVDRDQPGETSTRVVGNFLLGKLPAVVDGATNVVDVEDVAAGHLLAADKGKPGQRYILGGYNLTWVELIDRLAATSRKAKRELGYRTRSLEKTIRPTVDWYAELIERGLVRQRGRSAMSVAAGGMRVAERAGVFAGLRAAEGYLGRRL